MTMPRGSRTLIVDECAYRWCVSRGAILVEPKDGRGLIREQLDPLVRLPVGPSRVAQLVRHARGRGWSPDDARPYALPVADPFADPQGRDDYTWRRTLMRCLTWLEAGLGTTVELGTYWWEDGLGGRVRWGQCNTLPEVDHWEGAFGLSGSANKGVHSSVSGFPFVDGRPLRVDQEMNFSFGLRRHEDGPRYDAEDWIYWDGPGEWSYVEQVGDLFDDNQRVVHARGSTLTVELRPEDRPTPGRVGVALHSVEGEDGTVRLDPKGAPWLPGPTLWVPNDPAVTIDVARLGRRSGWPPGRHRVALRLHDLAFGEGGQSIVTEPQWITIPG